MATVVVLGCDSCVRVEEHKFRPIEFGQVFDEALAVLGSSTVGEWPVEDRDLELRCAGETLNLMEIAEVLPNGQRQRDYGAVGHENGRRARLVISHLKNSPDLVLAGEMQQCTPLHDVTIVAVPRLAQSSPLAAGYISGFHKIPTISCGRTKPSDTLPELWPKLQRGG